MNIQAAISFFYLPSDNDYYMKKFLFLMNFPKNNIVVPRKQHVPQILHLWASLPKNSQNDHLHSRNFLELRARSIGILRFKTRKTNHN